MRKRGQIIELERGKYRIRLEARKGEKRPSFSKTLRCTRKEAEDYLKDILKRKDQKKFKIDSPKFDALFNSFIKTKSGVVKDQTLNGYISDYEQYLKKEIGHIKVSELTPIILQEVFNDLKTTKSKKGGYLKPRTINRTKRILSSVLSFGVTNELAPRNIAESLTVPSHRNQPKPVFTPEEFDLFYSACRKHWSKTIWLLAVITSMRPQELIGLRWESVNFDKKEVVVNQVVNRVKKGDYRFDEPKTQNSYRVISINQECIDNLLELRKHSRFELVFCTRDGNPLSETNLWRSFKAILKRAGINKPLTPHCCRHTTATWMIEENQNFKLAQQRLGHSRASTTLDIYTHLRRDSQEGIAELLGNKIRGVKNASDSQNVSEEKVTIRKISVVK